MEKNSIYTYVCYRKFLTDHFLSGQKTSLQKLAKQLGYSSHRSIGMVMNGDRLPSRQMIMRLCDLAGLDLSERSYFDGLVHLEALRREGKDDTAQKRLLAKLRPKNLGERTLTTDEFRLIAEWYYVPIIILAQSQSLPDDASWLSRKFMRKLTAQQARHAIDILLKHGFISKLPSGRLTADNQSLATLQDVPSDGIKIYHTQMLARAREVLVEKSVEERCFQALTLTMSMRDLPRVKKRVLEFLAELSRDFEREKGTQLVQTNIQTFPLTNAGV